MADEHTPLLEHALVGATRNESRRGAPKRHSCSQHVNTRKLLNSRHVSMISMGGIIGTGLFMGVRLSLINGPLISLASYIYISFICYFIVQAVGEMSCYMPLNGGLCQFQFKFISNCVGVMNNFVYWLSWSVTLGLELGLMYELVVAFFANVPFSGVGVGGWIIGNQTWVMLVMWTVLTGSNLFPVNFYGEIEFAVTIIKIAFIMSWIVLASWLVWSRGGGGGEGFKNWSGDLMWGVDTFHVAANPILNKVINVFTSSLVSSCFTFQSIESVALCSGEIQDIHKSLPRSIKYIVSRIIVFYIVTLFLLTLMIPCNDPALLPNGDDQILSSPFLIGLVNMGVAVNSKILSLFNLVILISVASAANSNIYFGSRCLLSMVEEGYFWSQFGKTINGVPVYSTLLTSGIGLIALLSHFKAADYLFKSLITWSASSGLVMWMCLSISYLRFREALRVCGEDYRRLSYQSPLPMETLGRVCIASISVIILSNGLINIWHFQWENFLTSYGSSLIVLTGTLYLSYRWGEPILTPIAEIDIYTGQSSFAFIE
ncbi:uncharacterized protein LODBEIA_P14580 [Lodderomyces beijingensis]|uniref:Amino acid permease/ SLC12A domain-containing protein n=1 Tax=Lodderomyces beijingensis TaxID=1775926 RepID=A0ABP0ZH80_9ASCO